MDEQDQLIWLIKHEGDVTFWLGVSDTHEQEADAEKVIFTANRFKDGRRESSMFVVSKKQARAVAAALTAPWTAPGSEDDEPIPASNDPDHELGATVDELLDPLWQSVMAVLNTSYGLGMSGDPAETTDPEQIKRRDAVVDACTNADGEIRHALEAAFRRGQESTVTAIPDLTRERLEVLP